VSFGYPHLLWLLLLVPMIGGVMWWSWRARRLAMSQFVGSRLLSSLTVGLSRNRQKIRAACFLLAMALLLFSLARPQWGFDLEEARQRGLDIVVAIDTSKSMLADDIQPNRLTRAKLAALDLMRIAKSDRLGLVAFAGTAFLQCPLSLDEEAFRQSIEALDVNIIPQGGTAIGEAVQTALSAFKEKTANHKILVLFTDGEDNETESSALDAARAAEKEGLRVFTIGVGTPAGELLSTTDPYGNRVFIKDSEGNVVKSRLNEPLLQQIAKATDGFYLPLAGASTMEVLYERGLAPLPKSEFAAKTLRQYHDRFQWFLGAAIVLFLVQMVFPERAKPAAARSPAREISRRTDGSQTAAAVAQRVVAAVGLLAMALNCHASAGDALNAYNHGKYARARAEFERLAHKSPDDPRLRYNAGAAAFQDQSYEDALRHFSASLSSPDLKLQERSYYNLGNTQYRLGEQAKDPKEKQQSWEQALHDYADALKLDANDADARTNAEVVKKKLEELKKQQEQQKSNQKNDKNDKDEQKNDQEQDQQKQDQEKKDQQKNDQKKQDEKSEQEKKDQEQQQKQDQAKADEQKQKDEQQQAAQDQRGKEPEDKAAQAAQYGKVMQMTPQQAAQLLEAQKAEEKAMIFVPQNVLTNRNRNRLLKDW